MDTRGKVGVEVTGRLCMHVYTIDTAYKIDNSCINFGC